MVVSHSQDASDQTGPVSVSPSFPPFLRRTLGTPFSNGLLYIGAVLLGTFLLAVPPYIFLKLKKPGWEAKGP